MGWVVPAIFHADFTKEPVETRRYDVLGIREVPLVDVASPENRRPNLSSEDCRVIADWNAALKVRAVITLLCTQDAGDDAFMMFCAEFSKWAPRVDVIRVADVPERAPAIKVRPNLIYRAIPTGSELSPFLEALSGASQWPATIEAVLLDKIRSPVSIKLYIADGCPFCPSAVRQILPLAGKEVPVVLTVIDAGMFPEDADTDGIQSVPTLVCRDSAGTDMLRWTGVPNLSEVLASIATGDPYRMGGKSMEQMLQEGNAPLLARMMLEKQMIFPGFVDLLTHEKWPVRLGAMVVVESLADGGDMLCRALIEPLWARFNDVDDTVKGDILYVLGMVGDERLPARLGSVLAGSYSMEVKEAAQDAVRVLRDRLEDMAHDTADAGEEGVI
ncbi:MULTISPECIES: hypothetical protein [Desulfococcus]|jgi:thiol-disulfide isomerase/thioredoxin|uniref:Thioredoxin-like fold domain-containing protein n=1 Tax=Desulfococcus multivorans DSM 2059 TaxID=1121405 RepID=S7TQR6_DESML|nr:hypothetical protein [Desulfococcus multivorans]AQV00295.1 hypothetical protein B2D07_05590 [Desulfococcus multivorans]EPR39005.1 hypothetical protein dsmv_0415 [Desulfococcus multivorans DSM 2059]MDX9817649.1 hypothetical protein [Desulfococcus multivorans]SJZ65279.1 hypothetical protein SAMN02745446_01236 [Desulfococcus multivorans DSM 2059]